MGTVCASTYANLFLSWWEHQIFLMIMNFTPATLILGRYIDDVLILWEDESHIVEDFVSLLNHNTIGMKFTHRFQQKEMKISIDQFIQIQTNIYRKPATLFLAMAELASTSPEEGHTYKVILAVSQELL